MSKYNAKKTIIDGIKFDNKKESIRYKQIKEMEHENLIEDLELQPKFVLQPKFDKNDIHYRAITYKADFKYYDKEQKKIIIEDVKGMKTDVYKLKKKLFEYKFKNFEIKEI